MQRLNKSKNLTLMVFIAVIAMVLGFFPVKTTAATLDCSSSTTLEELFDCIKAQMRLRDDGYTAPTAQQLTDLRTVMGQMLDGQTNITLPSSISTIMEFKRFTDSGNSQTYSVLMEVEDANNDGMVDRGFGTFIVYNEAEKELNIASPHPAYDLDTGYEAIRVFKYTSSRSFSLAGTHRYASSTTSSCQSSYRISDAAHNDDCMFFAATQELMDYYVSSVWYQLQYHGMATDSCSTDVFMSHGDNQVTPPQGDIVYTFRDNVLAYNPTWDVDVDGATSCHLDGGSNTSGRLINGVPANQVCNTSATNYGESFIHIEQIRACRTASDWIDAVNDTFGSGVAPTAPSNLIASASACDQVDLTWQDNSDNETQFRIERSTNGSDYSEIDSVGADVTSYNDTTVAENTTYWYRVRAYNSYGYSGYSNTSSDTTPVCPPSPPAAPGNLTAKPAKYSVDLTWTDNSNNEDGFNIYRGDSPSTLNLIDTVAADTTSYEDTGLTRKTVYYYKVCAYNTNGESCSATIQTKTR
jgi:hypothetical protein